jgi:hypothetical protein
MRAQIKPIIITVIMFFPAIVFAQLITSTALKTNVSLDLSKITTTSLLNNLATKHLKTGDNTFIGNIKSSVTTGKTIKLTKGGVNTASSITNNSSSSNQNSYSNNQVICKTRAVSLEAEHFEQNIFSSTDRIFPGSFIDGNTVISDQLSTYILPAGVTRKQFQVSADLLDLSVTGGSTVELIGDNETISASTVKDGITNILRRNINASQSGKFAFELVDVTTREEVEAQLGIKNSVTIPQELTLMLTGIPVGVSQTDQATVATRALTEKNRLIVKIYSAFYDVIASTENQESKNFFTNPDDVSKISADALFVSSVTYGAVSFLLFESTATKDSLHAAVSRALEISALTATATQNIDLAATKTLSSNVTTIKGFGIGLSVTGPINITNASGLINFMTTIPKFSSSSPGAPIKYTLRYLKDDKAAAVVIGSNFTTNECFRLPLYEVSLNSLAVTKVVDNILTGNNEDLYGTIEVRGYYLNGTTPVEVKDYLNRSATLSIGSSSAPVQLKEGESKSIAEKRGFPFTIEQVQTAYIVVKWNMKDRIMQDGEQLANSNDFVSYETWNKTHFIRETIIPLPQTPELKEVGGDARIRISYGINLQSQ